MQIKSLKREHHPLAESSEQLAVLENHTDLQHLPKFKDKLGAAADKLAIPTGIDILQVNAGKMCNQVCKHCHVDAGPDRKEIMSREVMKLCLQVIKAHPIPVVDITGGAPEMNPNFRWFVEECSRLNKKVIVRCNLTIILANPKYHDLPEFYAKHQVEVLSSLPFYNADRTDRQRGEGVFADSIKALKLLNDKGYGMEGTNLILNLVYNPAGAFLPAAQHSLEQQFKQVLKDEFGIAFNQLFAITNMPVSRFLHFLIATGNYKNYMEKLVNAFNPAAAEGIMCRNTLSVGWDGFLYDCDFNQMLELKITTPGARHIKDFNFEQLNSRQIVMGQHCYGCTAGAGSSCGGTIA